MSTISELDAEVAEHILYRLANTAINLYPYPHFYITDIFPAAFYGDLARAIHFATDYHEEEGRYHGRQFGSQTQPADMDGMRGFLTKRFLKGSLAPFRKQLEDRYGTKPLAVYSDSRFIRDGRNYFIGPHTDAPWKLASFLFYLPIHDMDRRHGTSIFVPRDPAFRCAGGPHHDFSHFTKVWTAPFLPNTCFGFLKTNNSFHGVELIDADIQRDVFLFNVYDERIYEQTHKKVSNAATDEQPATSPSEQ